MEDPLDRPYRALQLTMGATAVAAGADKFFNLLTDWEQYLNQDVADRFGLSPSQFMKIVGVVEIAAGSIVLSGRTRFGGALLSLWLLGITANLLSTGEFFDIAARDLNMAVAAYTLLELSRRRNRISRQVESGVELGRAA